MKVISTHGLFEREEERVDGTITDSQKRQNKSTDL